MASAANLSKLSRGKGELKGSFIQVVYDDDVSLGPLCSLKKLTWFDLGTTGILGLGSAQIQRD